MGEKGTGVLRIQRSVAARVVSSVLLSCLGGCQLIGGGQAGPEASQPPGIRAEATRPLGGEVYQGHLDMEGSRIQAALELRREGGRTVLGALQGMSGLLADGEGTLRGKTLTLMLTYGGDCPGRMNLEGSWDQEEKVFEGRVDASDCTGRSSGTFRFSAT